MVHKSDFAFSYLTLRTSAARVTVRDIMLEQKKQKILLLFFFSGC